MNEDNDKKINTDGSHENSPMQKNSDLRDQLLKDIRSGEVAMRPKFYFTVQIVALIVVATGVLLVSVFIFNFMLFSVRINSQDTLLGFGPRGIATFFWFFPWHLLAIDILLVGVLEWLVRKFRLGNKVPILYLLAGLLGATLVLGFALEQATPLNDRLLIRSRDHRLPEPFNMVYDRAHRPLPIGSGVCRCTIISIQGNVLSVLDTRKGTSTLRVILPMNDPRATTTMLEIGDIIFIAGEEDDGIIRAFGVRKQMSGGVR